MSNFLTPPAISQALVGIGEKKAAMTSAKMLILGILAGVYIGIVTLGNLIGGALLTGAVYWWLYVKKTD
jgi:formate/nitrite transporter FocA (FNT family)